MFQHMFGTDIKKNVGQINVYIFNCNLNPTVGFVQTCVETIEHFF